MWMHVVFAKLGQREQSWKWIVNMLSIWIAAFAFLFLFTECKGFDPGLSRLLIILIIMEKNCELPPVASPPVKYILQLGKSV